MVPKLPKTSERKDKKIFKNFFKDTQSACRKEQTRVDSVFTLKVLLEKRREYNLQTYLLLLNYEKSDDEVWRTLLCSSLQERNIPNPLFRANIKNYGIYEIKVKRDDTLRHLIKRETGVTPGYSLSPFDLARTRTRTHTHTKLRLFLMERWGDKMKKIKK